MENMLNYYTGERNEAGILFLGGIILLLTTIAIAVQMNESGMLKGIFYPVLLLCLIGLLAGGFNYRNNQKRLISFSESVNLDQSNFIQQELKRFESKNGVNAWWLPLKITWTIFIILGLVGIFTKTSEFVYGLALGLILIGSLGMLVDGFAHQRAKIYTEILYHYV